MYNKLQDMKSLFLKKISYQSSPTVLIFDSGVGGLSVYYEIRKLLPDIHYIYIFDNFAFPYGEQNKNFIIKRIIEIITAIQQLYFITVAVIACNTASLASLPLLREKFQFPIVGAIPAIKLARNLTVNGVIGLLATQATVKCPYTHRLIERFANNYRIEMFGSSELVEIAEAKLHGKTVQLELLHQILQPWLRMPELPDTIVLGCTHFPLLQDELLAVLPKGTRLVDSGANIARRNLCLLKHKIIDKKFSYENKNIEPNIAYCTKFTPKTEQLLPTLQHYGFKILKKLDIYCD